MHLPEQLYTWLVEAGIISNQGEIDDKGNVTLPSQQAAAIDNGFLVGEALRKIISNAGLKVPASLANVKGDASKNTKLTNWSFLWLSFESIGLKLDPRLKELILQGEQALIVEVLRQLYERDPIKKQNAKLSIKVKPNNKPKAGGSQAVDIKKINLNKDPQESQTSLQFLILLLKASLGMNLQQILGLFTNQNKYLAHIIVKGINDHFDSIILFYTLLNKHAQKLKAFHDQDSRDAEACLYAIKPGFISKNQKVAELTLELFGKLEKIYGWFTSEQSKCAGTFLLGIKRHPSIRQSYWNLLLKIIVGEQLQFFTKYYAGSFQNPAQHIQITTYLLKYIQKSQIGDKILSIGLASTWLEAATKLPESETEPQIIAFDFIGEMMIYMPSVIEQNQDCLALLNRNWEKRTLPQFVILFNQLILVLEKLGEEKSPMARRIYTAVAQVAKAIGPGDKRDYLVENFLPLVSKFPTIPSEHLILHLKRSPLSYAEYLLICEVIDINQDEQTLISLGNFLRHLFIENPLVNFYALSLIKKIVEKLIGNSQEGLSFISSLLQQSLHAYAQTEIKYKPRPKQQKSMYFGRSGSPEKVSKQEQEELTIKEKWKEIYLSLALHFTEIAFSQENEEIKDIIKEKIMKANAYLKMNNHKIGSKRLEDLLAKKFEVTKDEQNLYSEEYKQKIESNNMEESAIKKSKAHSQATVLSTKVKAPEFLAKEFQHMIEKRKHEEEEKRALEIKKQLLEEKKRISVKKQLQITNLLRGQIGEAQIREQGFLQKLMPDLKQIRLIPFDELEAREVQAIDSMLRKYHRVLRHLFLLYTGTMYSNHTPEAIQDNQRRKQILTCVELGKMLKDYRMFYFTSQPEINAMVRDINVKLLNRREVNELDFKGFQQYIIQFCFIKMILPHEIAVTGADGSIERVIKQLNGQPIYILLKQFFIELKQAFLARKEKVLIFEDIEDVPLTKQQQYQVNIFNQKLNANPNYILPKGYKKIVQKKVDFPYLISPDIIGLPEKFQIAYDALDYILSQSVLKLHIMEDIAQKKVVYKVRPTALVAPDELHRQRAMSTVIDRKTPFMMELSKRGTSKGNLGLKQSRAQASQGENPPQKISKEKNKELVKPRKSISVAKLAEMEKARFEAITKRAKEKEQQRQRQLRKEKEEQKKRRIQTERFLEEQKAKFAQKKQKLEEERIKLQRQSQEKQAQKKENKQKFKAFHQNQIERIKKIELEVSEKLKRQKQKEEQEKEKLEEQRQKLREKIKEQDQRIVETRKEIQRKLTNLFQSQPIKSTFQQYEPNLKALFEFLIQRTHLSLTEKKHNNEIIYDTWRYFLSAFELSPLIIHAKDVVFIFKSLTRNKIVPKEYLVGLSYKEFEEALLRIAVKYKTIFNHISTLIKDKIQDKTVIKQASEADKGKKAGKKGTKQTKTKQETAVINQNQENEFESSAEIDIRELIKANNEGKDDIDQYGDLSKVNQKTLRGLIYYLKVPNTKLGQQQRFRVILSQKHKASVQNAERLKEKLNEQYTLETSPKKATQQKSGPQSAGNQPNYGINKK